MSNSSSNEAGIVGDVSRNLGTFFRHLLPGVFIVGAAYVAHPSWFSGVQTTSWQHIVLGATVALAVGNIWFAVNRYGMHQFIDWLAYLARSQGPAPGSKARYIDDLGRYVDKSLKSTHIPVLAPAHCVPRFISSVNLHGSRNKSSLCALA